MTTRRVQRNRFISEKIIRYSFVVGCRGIIESWRIFTRSIILRLISLFAVRIVRANEFI